MSPELLAWAGAGIAILLAVLRAATPILLAALGGMVSELAGCINVALEGIMLVAAFFGVIGALYGEHWLPGSGALLGCAAGLLAAFVVKPAAWHRFGLPPRLRDWLQSLVARRPTVIAYLGAPQGLDPLAEAPVQICTYSDVPVSQAALVERLLRG